MTKYSVKAGEASYEVQVLDERESVFVNGKKHSVDFRKVAGKVYSLILDGRSYEVFLERDGKNVEATVDGYRYHLTIADKKSLILDSLKGTKVAGRSFLDLKAPMPGLVVRLTATKGLRVEEGQGLLVLEAMKMENEIRAPARGTVDEVLVQEGLSVERGDPLVRLIV